MPLKDCSFCVSYFLSIASSVVFIVCFCRKWTSFEDGQAGLWSECEHGVGNDTKSHEEEECKANALANGPVWLEITRMLMCLALVCVIMGMLGYNFCLPKPHSDSFGSKVKRRLQELSYIFGGVLTISGCALYGRHYHEYYHGTEDRTDVTLMGTFIAACITGGLFVISSIVMFVSRSKVQSKPSLSTNVKKNEPANTEQSAQDRLKWLHNKKIPTPVQQKDEKNAGDEREEEVEVKESALKRIVAPTQVLLAFNRFKNGVNGKKQRDERESQKREAEMMESQRSIEVLDTKGKCKGIFVIDIDKGLTPPVSNRSATDKNSVTFALEHSSDSSSTTDYSEFSDSTQSSENEDLLVTTADGSLLPSLEKGHGTSGVTLTATMNQPEEGAGQSSRDRAPPRQKVRRSVTTMHENSKSWTLDSDADKQSKNPRPKAQRHLSHAPRPGRSQYPAPRPDASPAVPALGIYTLPQHPGTHEVAHPPPAYDQVLRGGTSVDVPPPVLTEQTQIYQPYST